MDSRRAPAHTSHLYALMQASSDEDRTADASAQPSAPTLPFAGERASPPAARPIEPLGELGATADLSESVDTPATPEADLEAYAWIRARHDSNPPAVPDDPRMVALEALWNHRFRANLSLFRRYTKLVARFREEIDASHG